ncbi:hypothetical protein HETIRDRAFT_308759 [Heterobasidion irregulare TC 32-1]|uniref:Uncharacterized protein n=1 Tax=Heterobasidion irregulare (strain TC 32-1) TaxID=747525 RepID=W4KKJ5_HETIT|nr:uncharacterized protein HETIRDRAFT_308759 [Heterobasidion irregulare TC 32-1]ETW86363.1 hypothetical protein HETIRDRAFT_308759 [Heterobasidion irregulare TC 32-1]
MNSLLSTEYPEEVLLSKGVLNIDTVFWADMILQRSADIPGAVIEKVEHYKCTDGFEHEFLAVHIDHPLNDAASGRKIVLFMERTQRPSPLTILLSSTGSPPPIPATDVISISSPEVLDPIQYITNNHFRHVLISTLQFDDRRPTDRDLSDLVNFVAAEKPKYDLKYQCYWFSSLIYDALRDIFGGQPTDSEHAEMRGHFYGRKAPKSEGWAELKSRFKSSTSTPETIKSVSLFVRLSVLIVF